MDSSATPSDPRTTAPPPSGAETLAALTRSGELAAFIGRQRWFAAKHRRIERLEPLDTATVAGDVPFVLALVSVDGERYYLPLALRPAAAPPVAPSEREVGRVGDWVAYDAHWEPRFGPWALESITWERRLPARAGAFTFHRAGDAKPADGDELAELVGTPLADEQSNTSTRLGRRFIFKSFRRPQPGPNPEIEVSHFLTTRTGFAHAAGLVGWIEYAPAQGESSAVGLLQPFLENLGDGWRDMQEHLRRLGDALVQEPAPARRDRRERRLRELGGDLIEDMALLGSVTGELHAALAGDDSLPAFAPEPVTEEDVGRWTQAVRADAERLLATLGPGTARLPDRVRRAARRLRGISARLEPRLADLALLSGGQTWKIRGHGDYHLGQVLRTPAGFAVIDFEGEPARPLAERRAKHSALRDVAGMLRSFDYAARAALAARPAAEAPALGRWIGDWTRLISSAFVRGYLAAAARSARPLAPASPEAARRAAAVFEIEKALYELRYELELRPDWVPIPVAGLARLLRARRDDRDP